MKILYVTTEVPFPARNGVRIPLYHSMRLMKEAGHDLSVITLTDRYKSAEGEWAEFLEQFPVKHSDLVSLPKCNKYQVFLRSLISNRMFFLERYHSQEFEKRFIAMIDKFQPDVIHFDLITMTGYRSVVPEGIRTVASINDSYSLFTENNINYGLLGKREWMFRKFQLWQSRKYEGQCYAKFDAVHIMTDVDADYLRKLNSVLNVVVIPNGVDESVFEVDPFEGMTNRRDLIYVGSLTGKYMRWLMVFLKHCWPQITSKFPELKFVLIGRYDEDSRKLEALIEKCEGVSHVSFAPNLMEQYSQSGVALVPIKQTCGLINKLVEAMAAGLAVFAPDVSCLGVNGVENEENIMMFKSEDELVQGLTQLLGDSNRLLSMQKRARELGENNYQWCYRSKDFEELYFG